MRLLLLAGALPQTSETVKIGELVSWSFHSSFGDYCKP